MIKNIAMITSTKRTIMLMKLAMVIINTSTVMKPMAINTAIRTNTGMGTAATNTRRTFMIRSMQLTLIAVPRGFALS